MKVKILSTQWIEETKSILCRVEENPDIMNGRNIITIEPQAFGLDAQNLNHKDEESLKKIATLLQGKYINIEST